MRACVLLMVQVVDSSRLEYPVLPRLLQSFAFASSLLPFHVDGVEACAVTIIVGSQIQIIATKLSTPLLRLPPRSTLALSTDTA